ncbi:MAG: DUF4168 domain-containing protein [Microcoleaceae cyanobacterium]
MITFSNLHRLFSQMLVVSTLSGSSLLSGMIPAINHTLKLEFNTGAYAQTQPDFTAEEISNYARAAITLESRRYQVMNEIKQIVGEVPRIICDEPSSINALPGNVPQIAVSYCDQARQMIERQNLTVTRFNQMTRRQQNDPQFREKIQAEILRLLQTEDSKNSK